MLPMVKGNKNGRLDSAAACKCHEINTKHESLASVIQKAGVTGFGRRGLVALLCACFLAEPGAALAEPGAALAEPGAASTQQAAGTVPDWLVGSWGMSGFLLPTMVDRGRIAQDTAIFKRNVGSDVLRVRGDLVDFGMTHVTPGGSGALVASFPKTSLAEILGDVLAVNDEGAPADLRGIAVSVVLRSRRCWNETDRSDEKPSDFPGCVGMVVARGVTPDGNDRRDRIMVVFVQGEPYHPAIPIVYEYVRTENF